MLVGSKHKKIDAIIIEGETPELSMKDNQHYKKSTKLKSTGLGKARQ